MYVGVGRMSDGIVQIVCAKSGFISAGFYPSLDDYEKALNPFRA